MARVGRGPPWDFGSPYILMPLSGPERKKSPTTHWRVAQPRPVCPDRAERVVPLAHSRLAVPLLHPDTQPPRRSSRPRRSSVGRSPEPSRPGGSPLPPLLPARLDICAPCELRRPCPERLRPYPWPPGAPTKPVAAAQSPVRRQQISNLRSCPS